ncbi:hypothetical protein [Roseicella aquatilis]|uniref:DUF3829 domain-containing protein n=1 Tax=Roseicella aquatilis TaxID=2527868 RepID=A0A4R4DTH5_9PROT|nr:hypothetical protein [Roseicella aquatilis]TCZ65322.1 hypothetical protein EXY23_03865 [Roseicella aquatilis]
MALPRITVLLLPVLLAACAGERAMRVDPVALRFATALETAEDGADAVVTRMDAFERLAMREEAAIAFAERRRRAGPPRVTPPGAGAAEAAGLVLTPAFTALGTYAHVLNQLAGGPPPEEPFLAPDGAGLVRAAAEGLDGVRETTGKTVPASVREAGLAGIAALAALPVTAAGQDNPRALAAQAAPQVGAVTALLRAVIGAEPGQGTRGVLRARRDLLDASHARFLAAIAADQRLGPGERYAIYRSIADLHETDPAPGHFTALAELLDRLDAANAALAAGSADGSEKVAAFEAAVARLGALAETSRRG